MANHANRGKRGPSSTPLPAAIQSARAAAGLTQTQAGDLIHTSCRNWQKWESGESRMHPAFFELFLIKLVDIA